MTETAHKLPTNETLVDRIADRLRNDSGTFLTEEDLYLLAKSSLERAFNEPTFVQKQYGKEVTGPSLMQQFLDKYLKQDFDRLTNTLVKEWVTENPERVENVLREFLQRAPEEFVREAFFSIFRNTLSSMQMNIENNIRNLLMNKGISI